MLIFGSVLPDIANIFEEEVAKTKIHYSPVEFYDFVKNNYPDLLDLALGVKLHSNVGKGADFYSDDMEVGFAKIEGRKIVNRVKKLLGIEDDKISLVLAHNFIEAGVDLNIAEINSDIYKLYFVVINGLDFSETEECLAAYLSFEKNLISEDLKKFLNFLNPINLASAEKMVNGMILPLINLKFEKSADRAETMNILLESKNLVKDKYLGFLNDAVEKMKIDFKNVLE